MTTTKAGISEPLLERSVNHSSLLDRRISKRWEVWKSCAALYAYEQASENIRLRKESGGVNGYDFIIGDELRKMKSEHSQTIRKLIGAGVSWRRVIHNNLDDPRLSESVRDELIQWSIRR